MSGFWKVLGALSALGLVVAIALRVPLPLWNWVSLLFTTSIGFRVWMRDMGRAAYERDLNVEIYGQDEKGRPKAPTYHRY